MRFRASSTYPLGLAIVVALGAASAVGAQADPSRRVPVKKEQPVVPAKPSPGVPVTKEPAPAPVAQEPTPVKQEPSAVPVVQDTAVRVATGEVVTPPAPQLQPRRSATRYLFGNSGFYVGVGAGTAVPYNQLSNLGYDSGFDVTVPMGWHRPGRTLGIRATLAYDQVHADQARIGRTAPALLGSAPDPKIYSAALDAVLKFPIGRAAREGRGLSLYTVGGGGLYLFRGFGGTTVLADVLGSDEVGSSKKNIHKWGIGAGAGMEYGIGPTALFFESRWVNVFTDGSRTGNDYLRWIPILVGVTVR